MLLSIQPGNRFIYWIFLLFLLSFATTQQALAQTNVEQNGFKAEVIQVLDGDSIKIRREGKREMEIVSLIGIEAPEISHRESAGQEPFGTLSQQYLSVAITRKVVRIEQDVQTTSPSGQTLGYIWLGDRLLNEEMVKQGLALLATAPPNVKYVERFQQAQTVAREAKKGIWNPDNPLTQSPSDFRAGKREVSVAKAENEAQYELPEFVEGCVVGNRLTKKYHIPSGRFYQQAKESRSHVYFRTPEDAEKAGYQRSKR